VDYKQSGYSWRLIAGALQWQWLYPVCYSWCAASIVL